jgi:hypothetical protein
LYRTPNATSMTAATRAVVHNSVSYPWAIAPLRSSLASRFFWRHSSRGGRPGEERTSYTRSFSFRLRSLHRSTELGAQPSLRATSLRDSPSSRSFSARLRRSTIRSANPFGRMPVSFPGTSQLPSLGRCQ